MEWEKLHFPTKMMCEWLKQGKVGCMEGEESHATHDSLNGSDIISTTSQWIGHSKQEKKKQIKDTGVSHTSTFNKNILKISKDIV